MDKAPGISRRSRRRWSDGVQFASILVCITAVALWIHGYGYRLSIWRDADYHRGGVEINKGILTLHWYYVPNRPPHRSLVGMWDFGDEARSTIANSNPWMPPPNTLLGFGVDHQTTPMPQGLTNVTTIVAIPIWFIVATSGGIAGVSIAKRVRERRRGTKSVCRGCGYDLTGNTSGVCPECGATVEVRVVV